LALLLVGCESARPVHDWSTWTGPGSRHFAKEELVLPELEDPIEQVNRAIWNTNDILVTWVIAPLASAYRTVVPEVARDGLGNVFTNLLFPGRCLNNMLQGKYGDSWVEVQRFLVNSTFGVGGFRDVATRWGIATTNEDFGQTLGAWGWRDSSYFVLPILGPTNVRDMVGLVGDTLADPAFYYPPTTTISLINRLSDEVQGLLDLMHTHYDYYELSRMLYQERRAADVDDDPVSTHAGPTDESAEFLKPLDADFGHFGRDRSIVHPRTGREVPYTLWRQRDPAPLVLILPGFGGHRRGAAATALAEIVFQSGLSAVTVSSTMNWELIETSLTAELPGYLPWDSQDVHRVLDAIVTELTEEAPDAFTAHLLLGLSFGGLTTLFIAADEVDPEHYLVSFDHYTSINSPIDLDYALGRLDGYYNTLLAEAPSERGRRITSLYKRALDLARGSDPEVGYTEPVLSGDNAEILVGFDFRNTVRDIIFQTQLRKNRGVLKGALDPADRRIYREIGQFSYREYLYAFLLPYVAELLRNEADDEVAARQLLAACGVRSIAEALAANPRVTFASSEQDVFLADDDAAWMSELLGPERISIQPGGPVFGNLGREAITRVVAEMAGKVGFGSVTNQD
jgi:phospholipid-binding lipoprotein MlaA